MKPAVSIGLVCLLLPVSAAAQRGTGAASGVASEAIRPTTFEVEGAIVSIKVAPCELTTGRSLMGMHLFLSQKSGDTLNVHLGPRADLDELASHLSPGKSLSATVFTTDRLPANAVVATSVTADGEVFTLRDATLKPTWSGQPRAGRPMRRGRR